MLNLTVNGIKDFQICERLYDFRYQEKLPEKIYSRDIYTLKFESTIKSILYFFWYKKQGGITPSYASLLNRWEKLWFPKGTDHYDIITEQHESVYGNLSNLTSKAAAILLNFHEKFSDTDIIPLAISEDYVAVINGNTKVEDKFDLIYRKDNKNYVVKFMFNYKTNYSYMYQIDFTAMYLGFKLRHPERLKETRFGYIDLLANNLEFTNYELSSEDIDSLEYWCDTIFEKDIFAPKRGLISYCKKCPFDNPCKAWVGWK
jgi:hypothetical protein